MELNVPVVLKAVLDDYALPLNGHHGVAHWARVLENGLRLAEDTGANVEVVQLFAVLHDSNRKNESTDPQHGPRAAEFALELRGRVFDLDDHEFRLLYKACLSHTHERTHPDVTIQTCWDSDRLDLGRVGITPHPSRLCTDFAKRPDTIKWADGRARFGVVPDFVAAEWGVDLEKKAPVVKTLRTIELTDGGILLYDESCLPSELADRYFIELRDNCVWEQKPGVFGHMQPRLTASYGDEGGTYRYSGTVNVALPWTPTLLEIKKKIEAIQGQYNFCLLNRYREYFGYARWFHEGDDFPMLQCVWPDGNHNYPWDAEYNAQTQPVVATEREWPFSEAKNLGVFTTRQVIEEGDPVLLVTHDDDGDWQFLCGTTNDTEDARLVCLKEIVEAHPSVAELADLPMGWQAPRDAPDQPWERFEID